MIHAGAAVLLPKPGETAEATPNDISLLVGPDFSLRCVHLGARVVLHGAGGIQCCGSAAFMHRAWLPACRCWLGAVAAPL